MMLLASYCKQLLTIVRTVPVWPGHSHALSLAEDAIISTPPMQRLARLRQMGLAYHAYPLCEHTRLSHSIGTVYWAMRMLKALRVAEGSRAYGNRAKLNEMQSLLGASYSLDLLIRVFALIHDVALLPLGHTLRFQAGRSPAQYNFADSLRLCLTEIITHLHIEGAADDTEGLQETMQRHLALAEYVAHAPRILVGEQIQPLSDAAGRLLVCPSNAELTSVVTFVYDLVHGVYSADLIDICIRDLHAIGIPWVMPETVIDAGIVTVAQSNTVAFPTVRPSITDRVYRYGVSCRVNGVQDTSTLRDLAHVHRTRLTLAEKGFYNDRKCVADAMLEKALRLIERSSPETLWQHVLGGAPLLNMGDDEFLDLLERASKALGEDNLIGFIRTGRLYAPAFTIHGAVHADVLRELWKNLQFLESRTALEDRIASQVGLPSGKHVIVSILPEAMQGKVPNTLVEWADGDLVPLNLLGQTASIVGDMTDLCEMYTNLRKLTVLVSPEFAGRVDDIAKVCRREFEEAATTGERL